MDLNQFLSALLNIVFFVFQQGENFIIVAPLCFLLVAAAFNLIHRFMRML